jgi:hypothetical protein
MSILNKQLLIRVSDELDELITRAYSKFLGDTGEHISRSDYMRRILNIQCELELSKDKKKIGS